MVGQAMAAAMAVVAAPMTTVAVAVVGWRLSPSGYGMKAMHAVQYGAVRCATVWHASARTADTPQMSPAIRAQPG